MENFGYFFMLVIGLAAGFGIGWWWKGKGKKLLEQEYLETKARLEKEKDDAVRQYKELVKKIKEKI